MTNTNEASRLADECKRLAASVRVAITRQLMEPSAKNVARCDLADGALEAAIDRLASLIPAGGLAEEARWQSMDAVPKDLAARLYLVNGRCVQGFVDATGVLCVQPDNMSWRKMKGKPTHWMPLPALRSALAASTPQGQEKPR